MTHREPPPSISDRIWRLERAIQYLKKYANTNGCNDHKIVAYQKTIRTLERQLKEHEQLS